MNATGATNAAWRRPLDVLACVLLVAAIYLIARPYLGIMHDAQLYVAQALNRQSPGMLANDLFFRYGSQDRFTIFSALFGPVVVWHGAELAAIAFAVIGAAFGLTSAWVALRTLTDGAQSLVATIVLAAWPGWYGGLRVMSLFEPFVTPRVWAAGLILLGLAAALRGRYWTSAVAAILATALHPLMALPGIAWIALAAWPRRYVVAALVVAGGGAAFACAMAVPPFDSALECFDPTWRELIEIRSGHLFLHDWTGRDLDAAGYSILGSILVAMRFGGVARRVFVSAAGLGALGVALTLIGTDWIGNILVTQLQPWRALWISTLAVGAGLGLLVARAANADREDWIAIAGAASGLLLGGIGSTLATALSIALLIGFRAATTPGLRRLVLLGAALMLAQTVAWYLLNRRFEWLSLDAFAPHKLALPIYSRDGALLSALAIGSVVAWNRWGNSGVRAGLVSAGIIAAAIAGMDWIRVFDVDDMSHRRFREAPAIVARLPAGTNVFWRGDALTPWLELGRPSYLSYRQTAGIVFSRDAALEAARRGRLVDSVLGPQSFLRSSSTVAEPAARQASPDSPAAVGLCADRELGGVYIAGAGITVPGVPLHDSRGIEIGRFVFCSDVRGAS